LRVSAEVTGRSEQYDSPNINRSQLREAAMTTYRTIKVEGLEIFYREAGLKGAPSVLFLHGFASSSHYYRNLVECLSDRFHLVAPDYPGFGNSESPPAGVFAYSFNRLADVMEKFIQKVGLRKFSLYMHDYGGPVGFRIAKGHPEWIEALIIQNANAYEEGIGKGFDDVKELWKARNERTERPIRDLLARDSLKALYRAGEPDPEKTSPDAWNMDHYFLGLPGRVDIQLELLYDYRNNLEKYPEWQAYFRKHQPPAIVVWGKNDIFFTPEGAQGYMRDLKNIEVHLLDNGHYAVEAEWKHIAEHIKRMQGAQAAAA
jgi:pimeloyl-ACP methyl ester carboxylesterase